ncbi:hypothetical protein [Stenomitos frigidus]|uniref:Uncharacterized protein n=1 Tax=Stenomitos frigidus ULC18 TaxID=2107698 RepID=A0A2T1E1C9_9CYAN|nr:hypothetical protein [Stenomitos frigidus]PSB26573.1 hypothetical protein C7B82_19330 [Stenomitos frigidus ULC18]
MRHSTTLADSSYTVLDFFIILNVKKLIERPSADSRDRRFKRLQADDPRPDVQLLTQCVCFVRKGLAATEHQR